MELIDTHTHLYLGQFESDRVEVVARAEDASITKMLLPNIDVASWSSLMALVERWPHLFVPMCGLHPCSVKEGFEKDLQQLEEKLNTPGICAVGEIGIDLYWDKSTLSIQQEAFTIQVNWAKERSLPIVIHARESYDELFELLDNLNDERLSGVFHCFTGTPDQARHILQYEDFFLGIGGVATFKNSGLDKSLLDIPLDMLMLETDAPYLAPVPHRGKRNESSYVRLVADKLSEIYGVPLDEVAEITTRNAKHLFKLD